MFYPPKLFFRDLWVSVPLTLMVAMQVYNWAYLIGNVKPGAEQYFLHYNVILGVDLVGEWWKMFYLPIGGLVILLINYTLSYSLYSSDKLLARILAIGAVIAHVFLTAALLLLIRLNS